MIKPSDPRQLAVDLLPRSICSVQVAAVLADSHGIFAWGWNSVGSGFGEHAEAAAIRRASKRRLQGATIYVASRRNRNGKAINSMPCPNCDERIQASKINRAVYRVGNKAWTVIDYV